MFHKCVKYPDFRFIIKARSLHPINNHYQIHVGEFTSKSAPIKKFHKGYQKGMGFHKLSENK